jgi:hypothetical protein
MMLGGLLFSDFWGALLQPFHKIKPNRSKRFFIL